jgi:hypothetical protein
VKRKTWFHVTLALVMLLALSVGFLMTRQTRALAPQLRPVAGAALAPAGTAFTYQGNLSDGGTPANGAYDFEFALHDAASGGAQVGSTVTKADVTVTAGLFTVELDFGGVFDGTALWLEVSVRPGSSSDAYTPLSPRQPLTAAPYALYSQAAPWSGLSGVPAGFADGVDDVSTVVSGTNVFAGEGLIPLASGNALTLSVAFAGSGNDTTAARTDHDHFGQTWTGSGAGLTLSGGSTGLSGSGSTYGVRGESDSSDGFALYGRNTAATGNGYGVYAESNSTSGQGVVGLAFAFSGTNYGVYGKSNSNAGYGVYGLAGNGSGTNFGVYGQSDSSQGYGVYGNASATSGANVGVRGSTPSTGGRAIYGRASATSGDARGVYGQTDSSDGFGVYGYAGATSGTNYAVYGRNDSTQGYGVYGYASTTTGTNFGVRGTTESDAGYAGFFSGNVQINGTLAKTAGSFKIDHPLDPQNQYLYHSFVESPDMKNIYDGVVTLDDNGTARVQMPDWFEALNQDFRYQLTPMGASMPNLYIAQEIQEREFQIAGGEPGMKVSWQVTGIRHDPYAEANRIPVEERKPVEERGTYLYPELYGQPETLGLDYQTEQNLVAP